MVTQIIAAVIFIIMFVLIVMDKIERHWVTLGCGLLMIILVFGACMRSGAAIWDTVNLQSFLRGSFWFSAKTHAAKEAAGINWETIVFIAGMMVMVEGMGRAGFFRWLCLKIAKAVNYKTIPILITFMIMSACLSMFIDSITVILFLAAVTLELARMLKFNPVPMIMAEIFCANLGGSATMCGDPPNIIIGTSLGYTFFDFLTHTGVIAAVGMVFAVIYFYFCFRKKLSVRHGEVDESAFPKPEDAITSKRDFVWSCIIFGCAIVLLVSHSATGLTVSTIGVSIAIFTLIVNYRHAGEILKGVDYKTLLFFVGLFIVVGGLERTGLLEVIANLIAKLGGGSAYITIAILIWISAIASAFVDNIPFAATMIPVIKALAVTTGIDISTMAWALALGTDIGGSGTPIGASANVVGIAAATRDGHKIGWGTFCKYCAPAAAITVAIAMVMIFIIYL